MMKEEINDAEIIYVQEELKHLIKRVDKILAEERLKTKSVWNEICNITPKL